MVDSCKCGVFIFCLIVFAGIIVALCILNNNKTEKQKGFKTKRPLPKYGPTIHYHPTFSRSSIVWQKDNEIANSFIEYNERDDIFIVKKASIFSIKVILHFDVKKLSRDSIGAACIVLSDGRKKCKAEIFLDGSHGIFHLKEKLYARPGFSFSIRILNSSTVIKGVTRNILSISQSFNSGTNGYSPIPEYGERNEQKKIKKL